MGLEELQSIVELLVNDATAGIYLLLLLFIAFLLYDRRRMLDTIEKRERQIARIADNYYKGNMKIVESLNQLKMLLIEIKGRIL